MALGHAPGEPDDAPFNMAVMGLRLAGMSNGVSKLHGKTSRLMFQQLCPSVPVDEVPIGSVTNGVHGRTWVSSAMNDLFTKYVNPAWDEAGAGRLGPHRRRPRRRAVAGPRAGQGGPGRLRARAAEGVPARKGRVARSTPPGPTRPSTPPC